MPMSSTTPSRSRVVRQFESIAPTWSSRLGTIVATLLSMTALAAVVGCVVGLYLFRPLQHDDPDRAARITAEMLRVDVPKAFEPRGTIEWDFFRGLLMRGAYYELTGNDGLLMFLQVDSRLMQEADVRKHVERTLREKGGGGPPLTIIASEDVDYFLGDQHVVFRRRLGESPDADNQKYQLVEGTVDGNSGTVLVAFRIAQEAWERSDRNGANLVEATIRSIRPGARSTAAATPPAQ